MAGVHLEPALALARVAARSSHFFSSTLVDSQFATLESPVGEAGVLRLDAALPLDHLLAQALQWVPPLKRHTLES
jgi:gluconokinase